LPVLDRLANALGRNDERPNVALAEQLAATGDTAAIAELADALATGTVAVQNDAIKVLYEIGYRRPELLAPHLGALTELLGSRNNRNVWGALKAIETVAALRPGEALSNLATILAAADHGSVIARDAANGILVTIAGAGHAVAALPILLRRLEAAAPNQFPTYAEQIGTVIDPPHAQQLIDIIDRRLPKVTGGAKQARLERLRRKLAK
jgi:hypothetical protein